MAPADPTATAGRRRLPRRRFWLAVAAGVLLMAAFLPLMEHFFAGSARTTWPAYAIVLPLALVAIALLGRSLWLRAAGAFVAGAASAFAVAFVAWFLLLSAFGGCGLQLDDVTWTEPGLYAHVDSGSFQPAYWGAHWAPPEGALPFAGRFAGQPDLEVAVAQVSWSGFNPGRPDAIGFFLARDGVVTATVSEELDNATLVRGFLAFTANVTTAPMAQRIAWADEFQSTRRLEFTEYHDPYATDEASAVGFHTHQARIGGPFRLEALANGTGAAWAPRDPGLGEVGVASASGGDYEWRLGLATWSVPVPHGSRGATLLVDPLDRVRFDGDFREGTSEDEARDRIREAMREDGLPEPTFQSFVANGSIC